MLILDRQKAVERVVALTAGVPEVATDPPAVVPHARTYARIATYVRRARPAAMPSRAAERRQRRVRQAVDPSLAY
jgi:hypothetical protein